LCFIFDVAVKTHFITSSWRLSTTICCLFLSWGCNEHECC